MAVLEHAKSCREGMITKSSIMLGLGETDEEVRQTMNSCFTGREILLFQLLSMFALNLPLSIVSASHNSA